VKALLSKNTEMVFITAGLGGGTGTGAAPIIAQAAKEMGILTVGIVTIPFGFEGKKRKIQADEGLNALKAHVDTLLVISNDKLREIYGNLKVTEAFGHADDILATAAKGIADIITTTLQINTDINDVKTVMKDSGVAIMGSAQASGEFRALRAVEQAMSSPLLNDSNIKGARYVLVNVTCGEDEITMDEFGEITDYIQDAAGMTAEVIKGYGVDLSLGDKVNVTIIATGFNSKADVGIQIEKAPARKVFSLMDEVKVEAPDMPAAKVSPAILEPTLKIVEAAPIVEKVIPVVALVTPVITEVAPVVEEVTPVVDEITSRIEEVTQKVEEINSRVEEASSSIEETFIEEETAAIAEEIVVEVKEETVTLEPFVFIKEEQPVVEVKQAEEKPLPAVEFEITIGNDNTTIADPFSIVASAEENVIENKEEEQNTIVAKVQNDEQLKKAQDRVAKLKELSFKLKSPNGLSELENEPAYKRRNVNLDSTPHSSESQVSRYTLSENEEKKVEIKPNNSFLHDNVD
ncbi:MAG: cell division protein FtsZ, partial [Bacteroidetes bacterium]|nr:cell division protein FtsZ [Bacteroidota bacterium]